MVIHDSVYSKEVFVDDRMKALRPLVILRVAVTKSLVKSGATILTRASIFEEEVAHPAPDSSEPASGGE